MSVWEYLAIVFTGWLVAETVIGVVILWIVWGQRRR